MNYEEKYKQALENFKKIKNANSDNKELVNFIEDEYPELKENNEWIRQNLYKLICAEISIGTFEKYGLTDDAVFSWLEKQGEQASTWSEEDYNDIDNIIWLCDNSEKGIEHTWIPSQAKRIKNLMNRIKSLKQYPHWKPI